MPRRGTSVRAAALRQAQQAKAARDAERVRREQDIEAALTDYFEATGQARRIRAEAQRKAGALLAGAERAAHTPDQAAVAAVRRLRHLTGRAADVAALCGITASAVRSMLTEPVSAPGPGPAAGAPPGSSAVAVGHPAHGQAGPGTARTDQDTDPPGDGHRPGAVAGERGEDRG